MKNWLKRQIINVSLAFGNVEKNVLNQESVDLSMDVGTHQKLNQNSLMEALLRGELTEEVKDFRWAMYKAFKSSKRFKSVPMLDESGNPKRSDDGELMFTVETVDSRIENVKTDESGDFKLIMVLVNDEYTTSVLDILSNLNYTNTVEIDEENNTSNIENDVKFSDDFDDDYNSDESESKELIIQDNDRRETCVQIKDNRVVEQERPIKIHRELPPKFKIENYTKHLHIKEHNGEYLLEFYLSKYPDMYDRKTNLLVSDLKKLIGKYSYNSMLDFKNVEFVTNDTIGADDYQLFKYEIVEFDRITEYNQYYVLKFKANVIINGEDLLKDFIREELDKKYENKEAR